ncbi:MAG: hypothetical protein QF824_04025 [Candidatus Woesearchaeota archaeon]|jgi:hypothetical protein|nr:hypothetical protein [Candidatus Woesearchaeota archaeon]
MQSYLFLTDKNGEKIRCLSILDPKKAFKKGMISKAIMGIVKGTEPKVSHENFVANKEFKDFMHSIISKEIFNSPTLKEQAKKQKEGQVYIIDARTKDPKGNVPPYDIVGVVKVEGGKLVSGSYQQNNNHALVSPEGIFQLPESLEKKLVEEVNKLQ